MKSEWKDYCLGDVVSLTIDHRGITPKKLGGDWAEVGYRTLRRCWLNYRLVHVK